MKKYALISVYDKNGLLPLADKFVKLNIQIISTGGTAKLLQENKIPFIHIEKITKNPESFDGRMKSISFEIASGILFDRNNKKHQKEANELNIPHIDFVICNFYPFWKNPGIEMIDVGGPTMVRSAAKNFESVTVISDPEDYSSIINELNTNKETHLETRKKLAAKAFNYVAWYDGLINNYFQKEMGELDKTISLRSPQKLRYGENPHQKGFMYKNGETSDKLALGNFKKLQGKEISFNNYLDLDSGLMAISLIGTKKPSCVILKHTNPCGAAISDSIEDAFNKAWFEGDPLAAFGGVLFFNRKVTEQLAIKMLENKKFFEIVAAPGFDKKALEIFANRTKIQLLENKALSKPFLHKYDEIKTIRGGYLLQDIDSRKLTMKDLKFVTKKKPNDKQIEDLFFAWHISMVSKSNCVTVVKNNVLLSSGVGQQDRKRCCELCVSKSIKPLKGAVAATDGFFPFRDGPDVLLKAGIKAIIQPGGSIRDQETIDACNENDVAMIFTGIRSFKH